MSKRITAAELMARLNADPSYVAARAEREEAHRQREAKLAEAERPLVAALQSLGLPVDSVWELVSTSSPYREAIPVLFEHLGRKYPPRIREGIARALAVAESRPRWSELVRAYEKEREPSVRDGLAVAIATVADDAVIEDVLGLASDVKQGPSRVLLLCALERSANPQARRALEKLASDPELTREVRVVLRRLKRRQSGNSLI